MELTSIMRTRLLWLGVLTLLLIGLMLYRYGTSNGKLNVEPNAAKEIEKAKQR
jgi:hypothetical protein